MKPLQILAFLLLSGCATTKPPVLIPVAKPCVTGEIPPEPEKVAPKLTGDAGTDAGIIAGSALELRAWGRTLADMLKACVKPR